MLVREMKLEQLTIRKSTPEDMGRIQQIYEDIRQKKLDFALKGETQDCFVAELDGKVVGYVIGYSIQGGFGLENSAWLSMIGIDPSHMGEKIGKQLADEALNHYKAQGYKTVYVSVQWDATDLLSFFKTLGFDRSRFINLEKSLS